MNILTVNSSNILLKSYNSSSLNKIQINVSNNKNNPDKSLKELPIIIKGKHLARENLNVTYNSNINKKMQESLERKLSQLSKLKDKIENKDKKDDTKDNAVENPKIDSYVNVAEKIKDTKETSLSEEEPLLSEKQINLQDINKKIIETNFELKDIEILAQELSKQSEVVDAKIYMFKKMYVNDMFKKAEKEAILKQVYDTRNNPLLQELKSTFNEIIELEEQLNDKLNKDQPEEKKEI
ncbi:hypothetical protein [Paraclostridium sordellii]|uniref:hypothetical protein n=1 Tax=Paraclostridium sordellii TaxID=1505 RepID=UPI0005E6061F|nr:hypothetical protein [Paeniclostridium sordellii]CEQ20494.1 Uncharacterised protein [[Clostridium] sordellii] [Paeniclostridium sordellii]